MTTISNQEIEHIYDNIKEFHSKYLKKMGVSLPRLTMGGKYTKNALLLVFLAQNYPNTKVTSKDELTAFIRQFYQDTNDVQQARHLAAQSGWYIASGQRNDYCDTKLSSGDYLLVTMEEAYPGFNNNRREIQFTNFDRIKESYNYRCATCGSKEGEPNIHWPSVKTSLQKGHMDPNKPLTLSNTIPQCPQCNRADTNNWIYDSKGRVIAVANPRVIEKSTINVQKSIYSLLQKKFSKKNN